MVNKKDRLIRASKEMEKLINEIKIEFILQGKKAPPTRIITKVIAKNIRKENIINHNDFIRFWGRR